MSLKPLTILSTREYFSEITQKIAVTKSGERVSLMVMSFQPTEPLTTALIHEVIAAAARGVHVQLNVDAINFMENELRDTPTGPLLWHGDVSRSRLKHYQDKYAVLEELCAHGGKYCIMNMPRGRLVNPYAGRSHIKLTVINDTAYIGGCNLSKSWQIDLMVRIEDRHTADQIHQFILDTAEAKTVASALGGKNAEWPVDDATTILVDVGAKRQSLIYDQALRLIDEAKDWIVMTCQYFPGSTTARHLMAAHKRGVNVRVDYARQTLSGLLSLPHMVVELGERVKYPTALFQRTAKGVPRLHAKLLATEAGAMIGSHNYVTQGVNFGTAEATLLRRDAEFASKAVELFKAYLAEIENQSKR